ncbi:hypothetical protein JXM67_01675 [candidate division WOR-3 bacterium]|nr:hypothetical protein [candidate division WOR-3 bacterium]
MTFLLIGAGCLYSNVDVYVTGVDFTAQPQGGAYVQSISATFDVTVVAEEVYEENPSEEEGDITIKVQWMTDGGVHSTSKETVHWYLGTDNTQSFTTTFSAPEDSYLDKTFWVKVSWEKKTWESEKASCIVP